jgi:hypothetical protein
MRVKLTALHVAVTQFVTPHTPTYALTFTRPECFLCDRFRQIRYKMQVPHTLISVVIKSLMCSPYDTNVDTEIAAY